MSAFSTAFWRAAAAVTALAMLAGCGGDDGAEPVPASEFCDAYADAICGGLEECCTGPINVEQCRFEYYESCEQNILTLDDRGLAPTGPSAPARIVFDFDEEGAGALLARLRKHIAACDGASFEESMFDATHFLSEPGAECLRNEDCIEGTRCEHPPRAVFGTCVIAPLPGELCTDVCAYREDQCVLDPADGRDLPVCVAPRDEGQTCDVVGCKSGLICRRSPERFEPICMAGGQPGAACGGDLECLSGSCSGGRCAPSAPGAWCSGLGTGGF